VGWIGLALHAWETGVWGPGRRNETDSCTKRGRTGARLRELVRKIGLNDPFIGNLVNAQWGIAAGHGGWQ
jgi:hypothetical protein